MRHMKDAAKVRFAWTVAVLSCLIAGGTKVEATDGPLSLEEAINHALEGAPQVVAAGMTWEAAQAVAPSAGRLPDPELIAGVENLPVNTADRFSLTRDFMTMRKIGLMQSFPNAKKRRLRSERAEREVDVAQAELRKTRFQTARATAEAWIARAVAEESLARLRELESETALQAAAARAALGSGRASVAEALAAQTLAARLDEQIAALEQEGEMARAELSRWIGEAAERPSTPIPTDREIAPSMESLMVSVTQHAPLAPRVAELAAAKADIALARAERRPDWSTELSYAQRGPEFSDMVSLEFRVGLPLFAKHRQNPVIAEKLATARAREAEREAEVRMHVAEVKAAFAQWRTGQQRLAHYRNDLVPLAQDRSRTALAVYGAGRGDLRGAIEAVSEEIDTQVNYVQLQGAVARAWVFLHLLHDSEESP